MHVTKKLLVGLGTSVLSLALVGGVAAAAFAPADAQARDEKGKPPVAKLEEVLGKLVTEGKLSAEQSAVIIARLKEVSEKVTAKRPGEKRDEKKRDEQKRDEKKKDETKDERRPEEKGRRIDVHALIGNYLKTAMAFLKLEEKALQEQLRAGKSLAEIAGADKAGLILAISVPANAKIDAMQASGKLTPEAALSAKKQVIAAVTKLVDAKRSDKRSGDRKIELPKPAVPKVP